MFREVRDRPDYSAKNIWSLLQSEQFDEIANSINQRFELVGDGVVTGDWVRTQFEGINQDQRRGSEDRNNGDYFNWFKRKLDAESRLPSTPYDRKETEAEQFAGTLNMMDIGNYRRAPCNPSEGQFLNPGKSSAGRPVLSDYQGLLVPINLTAARVAPLPGSGAE